MDLMGKGEVCSSEVIELGVNKHAIEMRLITFSSPVFSSTPTFILFLYTSLCALFYFFRKVDG